MESGLCLAVPSNGRFGLESMFMVPAGQDRTWVKEAAAALAKVASTRPCPQARGYSAAAAAAGAIARPWLQGQN